MNEIFLFVNKNSKEKKEYFYKKWRYPKFSKFLIVKISDVAEVLYEYYFSNKSNNEIIYNYLSLSNYENINEFISKNHNNWISFLLNIFSLTPKKEIDYVNIKNIDRKSFLAILNEYINNELKKWKKIFLKNKINDFSIDEITNGTTIELYRSNNLLDDNLKEILKNKSMVVYEEFNKIDLLINY